MLEVFKTHSAEEQKNARIQVAHRLLFGERLPAAKELLEEVLKGEPKCVPALAELASLHGMAGQWQDAMTLAGRALSFDRRYRPAQIVMANASYAMGRFDAALDMTRSLYASAPGDGQTLLLHAKVTHAAHAYREEIDVLHNVISIMLGKQQPLGVWQIYLGQANAAIGEGAVARELFKEALKDTSLSESDRAFAEKAVERYAPKADMLNSTPSLPESSLLDAPAYRP